MTREGDDVLLSIAISALPAVDREARVRAASELARRAFSERARLGVEGAGVVLSFRRPAEEEEWVERMGRRLQSQINAALTAPVTPKAVDRALGITARERIRWYKDGRLPICGKVSASDGRRGAHFPLFPFDEIVRLQANPDLIEAWRREDGGCGGE
jgi:hypothetical protein